MKQILLLLCGWAGISISVAQNKPIGEWESLYSYTSAKRVIETGNRIFCASYNGLFSVNQLGQEIRTLSKSEGLSDVGVSSMAFDPNSNTILVAYRSGNLDLLVLDASSELTEVINLPILADVSNLPTNKQINQIIFHDNLAYLGSNFGIVVIDIRLSEVKETYRYIGTQGAEANVKDLTFTSDSLFAVTEKGIIGTSLKPSVNRQYFASWKAIPETTQSVSLISRNNELYAGFPGSGISKRKNGKWNIVYSSTSPTFSFSLSGTKIVAVMTTEAVTIDLTDIPEIYRNPLFTNLNSSLLTGTSTLWLADQKNGLIGNPDKTFRAYNPAGTDTTIATRADSTVVDQDGIEWSRLPAYLGGGIIIKNPKTAKQRYLSTSTGSGGLPSSLINSLVVDRDGYVWFASDNGVGYFVTNQALDISRIDAILPVYGQRKLLNKEQCTALAVEPGNRKWIGSKKGLYLFSADGSEMLLHFSTDNSPLPSNEIRALRFDSQTGVLFADTPNGMVSYRSGATTPEDNFSSAKIFPNPVRPGYNGNLGITGLTENSVVKITSLSGRLVFEARSQGGAVSWNLNDYSGRRAAGGIYIVMAISEDKNATFVGKFTVID